MILEDLRKALEPFEYPNSREGVDTFFIVLNSSVACINPKTCGTYPVSERQHCVYNNALDLLYRYERNSKLEHLYQCVSEIYDIAQNYRDTNHNISIGELCLFETVLKIYNEVR